MVINHISVCCVCNICGAFYFYFVYLIFLNLCFFKGPVCYSSTYRDDKYIYRHIILSDNVRQYAEKKVRRTNAFLTEHCIINELQIDIGKGWKHFMIYDGKIRELILRKVLTAEDKLRMAVQMQRYN